MRFGGPPTDSIPNDYTGDAELVGRFTRQVGV